MADTARGSAREATTQPATSWPKSSAAARRQYDAVRDEVAVLGPPARLGGEAPLVDEWHSLVEWAGTEAEKRRGEATQACRAGRVRRRSPGGAGDRARSSGAGSKMSASPTEPSPAARRGRHSVRRQPTTRASVSRSPPPRSCEVSSRRCRRDGTSPAGWPPISTLAISRSGSSTRR